MPLHLFSAAVSLSNHYETTAQNAKVTCCSSLITNTRPRGSHSKEEEEDGDEDEDDKEEREAANSLLW